MSKTVNRGWLKRQIEAGKMQIQTRYTFDPMTDGPESGDHAWRTATMSDILAFILRCKSGHAYDNGDSTITLAGAGDCYHFRANQ